MSDQVSAASPAKSAARDSRLHGNPIAVAAVVVVLLSLFLVFTGAAPLPAVLAGVVLGVQMVAGFVLWRWLRPAAGSLELVGMSIALGTAAAALAGGLAAPITRWGWVIPTAIAVPFVLRRWRGAASPKMSPGITRPELIALVVGLPLALLTLAANLLRYPLTWSGTWGGFHSDMVFFEALSRSVSQFGPWESIFTPGERILYHWLSYGWAGDITLATGAAPFVALTRVLPFVSVMAGILLVIAWSRRINSAWWVPSLAVVLLLLSGNAGVVYGSAFNFDSPSQSLSAVWLIAWAMVISLLLTERAQGWYGVAIYGTVFLLGAAIMLAKTSAGAVAAGTACVIVLVGMIMRAQWTGRSFAAAIATVAGAALVFLLFLYGSQGAGGITIGSLLDRASSQQGFNPIPGRDGIIAGTALVVLAIALRWAALPFLFVDKTTRRSPEAALATGLVVTGIAGVLAFNGGQNELWFAAASVAPLSALTAAATAIAWSETGGSHRAVSRLIAAAVLSVVLTGIMWFLWLTGPSGGNIWQPTLRWLTPLAVLLGAALGSWIIARSTGARGLLAVLALGAVTLTATTATARLLGVGTSQLGAPPQTRGEFFTMKGPIYEFLDPEPYREIPGEALEAAAIIRSSNDGGLIATNMTASSDVPALTGRQTLVSGTWYQAPYGPRGITEVLQQREATSWTFIDSPSQQSRAALCAAGVSWVWIDPRRSDLDDWSAWGVIAWESETVVLLDISREC